AAPVERFVEKPDAQRAAEMLAEGGYFWNSGMFMVGAQSFLDECAALSPECHRAACDCVELAQTDFDFLRLDAKAFAGRPTFRWTTRSSKRRGRRPWL